MKFERPKVSQDDPPENWQGDNLSRFISAAHQNTFALFVRQPELWTYLDGINDALDHLISEAQAVPENVDRKLLERMHYAYLSALRLFTALQYPDTFVLLRNTIEYGLYEFYFTYHPNQRREWQARDESVEAYLRARGLRTATLYNYLIEKDEALGNRARALYDAAINAGAHPNPQAVRLAGFVSWTEGQEPEFVQSAFGQIYTPQLAYVAHDCAVIGITALEIAATLLPEDADRLGVAGKIMELQGEFEEVGRRVWDRIENG